MISGFFKENFEGANDKIKFLADSGFQGILEFHQKQRNASKIKQKPQVDSRGKGLQSQAFKV